MNTSWNPLVYDYKKPEKFKIENLIDGKNPAVVIKNFYERKSCQFACSKIKNYSIHNHEEGLIKKIGVFLSAYLQRPDAYFNEVNVSQNKINEIFDNLENPIEKIKSLLSSCFQRDVSIAKENGKEYSSSIIRIHEKNDYAPLHRDNAKFEAEAFSVSSFDSQLSCVLHLQSCSNGGDLKIYRQFWKKQDEKFRNPGFGYSKNVLDSKEYVKIKPEVGDLIIINPLFYHEVLPILDFTRISLGTFFGYSKKLSEAVIWA